MFCVAETKVVFRDTAGVHSESHAVLSDQQVGILAKLLVVTYWLEMQ